MRVLLSIALLLAVATAVPTQDTFVPEAGLAQVREAAKKAHKEAKKTITAMLESGSDDSACADLATTTLDEVTNSVADRQAILDALDTGADCPSTMAGEVSDAEDALTHAQTAKTDADTAAATAQSAEVHFESRPFSSLTEGECSAFFSDPGYTSAKANAESTAAAATAAASTVTAMETALTTAQEAQVKAIKECQCKVYHDYTTAFSEATSHADADAAAWKKGKHMQCVLTGTDPTACDTGVTPTVHPITLAPGVTGEGCEAPEESPEEPAEAGQTPTSVGGDTCEQADTYAGLGGCSAEVTEQHVADYWCKTSGFTRGASWTMVTGSHRLCYVSGSSTDLSGTPVFFASYGCSSSCKCMQNLKCL